MFLEVELEVDWTSWISVSEGGARSGLFMLFFVLLL